ncbi:DUF805 domain-containing protein [Arthrobacter sp. 08Y14]|uniref:DUF805 domain-containing protein n=1 Tax=Arthrobacter sp. 08Y14 TaxID=2058885 RepID=UPI0021589BCA|nr:DUF805 domain-containing protein [Arthrobacter sp. 08Y14]
MSNQYAQHPQHAYPNPASSGGLAQPLPGASFGQALQRFFKKYATFSGRASRSEYWWVMLFNGVITGLLAFWAFSALVASIDPWTNELTGSSYILPYALLSLYGLAVLVPGLALLVRRLHDGGFSAWFLLLGLIPFAGSIAFLVFALMPSNPEGARFDAGARQQQYVPYPQA